MKQPGDVIFQFAPGRGNPRNSEGAFIELKDGRLLFIYTKYIGTSYHDHASAALARTYSNDKGKTWSESEVILLPKENDEKNVMSVSLMRMANSDIGLFYEITYGFHDARLYLRRSSDEGDSWGEPVCCMAVPGYYCINNDRIIRLSGGRLVVPASYAKKTIDGGYADDSKYSAHFFISDDDGYTWRESGSFGTLNCKNSYCGLQEPGVIELTNHTLWAWARTDLGLQYEMFSSDNGETWSPAEPSVFTSPLSPLSMKRIPQHGYLLAVWNPVPAYNSRIISDVDHGRTPLIGAISKDEGVTWDNYFTIEDDKNAGYCYTAIHFTEDSVLLAYCAGNEADGICLARLRAKRIPLSDIV